MIELVVVMAILGLLLSLAVPRYLDSLERGKAQVVAHDLAQMRKAIDQYYGDKGSYPEQLEDLVTQRYLRALPVNPFTDSVDWIVVPPPGGQKGAVFDVQSVDNPSPRANALAGGTAAEGDAAPPAPDAGASEAAP